MSVVLEPVKADLMLSDTQMGLLTGTSFVLVFALVSIPLGWLSDITNRRNIIVAGILVWSLANLACAFASSFWQMFIARLWVGFGEASLLPAGVSLITGYFSKSQMTKGLAVFMTGNSLGRAAAFLGGGALLGLLVSIGGLFIPGVGHFLPWEGVFFITGLLGIAVAFVCLTIREPVRTMSANSFDSMRHGVAYFWRLRGVYMRVFVLYGLVVSSAYAIASWTISLYVRNYDVSVGNASLIVGITSLVAGPIGNMFGGWLSDRLISRNWMAAPVVVAAAMLALSPIIGMFFWFSNNLWLTIAAYTGTYFVLVACSPACISGVQLVTPEQYRGVITSFYVVIYLLIGIGLGPLLVGVLNDYMFGSTDALGQSLTIALWIFALVGVPFALSKRREYEAAVIE